jgi:hypothetical protein
MMTMIKKRISRNREVRFVFYGSGKLSAAKQHPVMICCAAPHTRQIAVGQRNSPDHQRLPAERSGC